MTVTSTPDVRTPPRPRDGLLLVDKESGITSHDAVDLVRRRTKIRKIGHTGTLDPLATGLLVLCIGRTTRLQAYLMKMDKTYEGTIQFGWATDTYDSQGQPAGEPVEKSVEHLDIESLLDEFRGEIEQMPPPFSAKKVGGVRAYELARKGETPKLEAKRVSIPELTLLAVRGSQVDFRLRCTAGTYVRSVAHALGVTTGLGAHLRALRRTRIGSFDVSNAIPTRVIREGVDDVFDEKHFVRMHEIDLPLERVMIDRSQEAKLLRGQSVIVKPQTDGMKAADLVSITSVDNELLAIAEVAEVLREGGPLVLQPRLVLKE
ncbi:MAG: tRNA pseudouridine(55) synthase TruB [Acidobacteriota bacterium]